VLRAPPILRRSRRFSAQLERRLGKQKMPRFVRGIFFFTKRKC
jgi:hypothetical protein